MADDTWADALHRLWRTASTAEDVSALVDDLYAPLLTTPGVRAVVGTRWDDAPALRSMRSIAEGRDRVAVTSAGGPMPAAADRVAAWGSPPEDRLVAGLDEAAWPEARLLREAGADRVLTSTFRLDAGSWAAFSLGLGADADVRVAADRLRQVVETVVACQSGIDQRGRERRRRAADALLAEASLQMDSSLDVEETLRRVARIAVPAIADGCLVHLLTDGRPRCLAATHVAARRQRALAGLGDDPWLADVIARTGDARVLTGADLDGGPFASAFGHPLLSVNALRARGRLLGTITFLYERADAVPPADGFLRSLADRAALAIDTSVLYEQRRRTVLSLQQHLLPSSLPTVPHWDLAAEYEVGDPVLDVGGDFYDVVPSPGGGAVLFIGDVCGRGAEAAALTGLARHTLRTLLEEGTDAAGALSRLNRALLQEGASRYLTVVVASLTPRPDGGARIRVANAGHPPPLILHRGGAVTAVAGHGLLLGVFDDVGYSTFEDDLDHGDTLVLYTDGLTEARTEDGSFFEEILPDRLAALRGADAATVIGGLARQAGEHRARGVDDIALLAARWTGPERAAAQTGRGRRSAVPVRPVPAADRERTVR